MQEIELKFFDVDVDAIAEKLERSGAPKKDSASRSVFFSHESLHLSFAKRNEHTLRVREMHGDVRLTFKGPIQDSHLKIQEELQVTVSSFETTVSLLVALGLHASKEIHAHRTSYQYKHCSVEIDRYPGVPAYIEIEGPSEAAIRSVCTDLGLVFENGSNKSISEIYPQFFTDTS